MQRDRSAGARDRREMEPDDLRPLERVGPRRACGSTSSTTSCTCCSPASATATTPSTGSVDGPRARADADRRRERLVVCAQNHDQVGNRALGDRLPPECAPRRLGDRAVLALRRRCSSWARSTTSAAPFQFFTDHIDPRDRRGDARGAQARVRSVRGVRRRRRARPAGAGDVPALAAHPERGDRELALLPRAARAAPRRCRASSDVDRPTARVLTLRRGDARARRRLRRPHRRGSPA